MGMYDAMINGLKKSADSCGRQALKARNKLEKEGFSIMQRNYLKQIELYKKKK